eukprot:EC824707.1.p3 GENE.EC824707.1~~EC824707.1.p3  ORF type:complete len:67 (-),score=15.07 EC824707.1:237-437(-)
MEFLGKFFERFFDFLFCRGRRDFEDGVWISFGSVTARFVVGFVVCVGFGFLEGNCSGKIFGKTGIC